ncbi:MAG: hypothetical protein E3J70_01365 [Candidatus Heimdallarchaeota archaeon]|nr:MAG: hypothetical protein E3J70_01365 [Candidatus Heimdallarchaeota archaeon]
MKTKKFEQSMHRIKVMLEEENKIRDSVLQQQRRIIRVCSEAIKSIHRKEFDIADEKIAVAKKMLKEVLTMVKGSNSLECWRGLNDAAQELGEAIFISSMIRNDEIPSVEECQISFTSYMLAASDAIGELRRFMMDSLRTNDFENAQRAFEYMDYLYSELMTIDYTKMLVGPLRSKLDAARNLVNRTRSDLINAKQAFELKESMLNLSDKLEKYKKKI